MSQPTLGQVCPKCGVVSIPSASTCTGCAFSFSRKTASGAARKVITTLAILALLGLALAVAVAHHLVTSSPAYFQALKLAESSPEVQAALGDSIKPRVPALGYSILSGSSQFTVLSVRIAGSRSGGQLRAVANGVAGTWEFSRLTFQPDLSAGTIDITPVPSRVSLPPVPAKKIYLLPVALDATDSVAWAPDFYKAKLGADVELLDPTPLPSDVEDPKRHQVDSEHLIDWFTRRYSELAQDPSNILVAVTSRDIFIPSFNWSYAVNFRRNDRFAVVSSAGFRLPSLLNRWNPEWSESRFRKMLTKNLAILYFDLPLSSDYTSMLSGGVMSGHEADLMSGSVIGGESRWDPFWEQEDVGTSIYAAPGKAPLWRFSQSYETLLPINEHLFSVDLSIGLFSYRKADFLLGSDSPFPFIRNYHGKDTEVRAFGVGTTDSLDIFLIGEMGKYIDLIYDNGSRIHLLPLPSTPSHPNVYQSVDNSTEDSPFFRAVYAGNVWTLTRRDGWKFYFPYKPRALPAKVTVLTGFSDPAGRKYEMIRNDAGDLLSIMSPSGEWLHFDVDSQHRIQSITSSSGRIVSYEYDPSGRLFQVKYSDRSEEHYTYTQSGRMESVRFGSEPTALVNKYDLDGSIISQTMSDGKKFGYHYVRDPQARGNVLLPDVVTTPNGLVTYIYYRSNYYSQSLPGPALR